jgi:hypothetical protein
MKKRTANRALILSYTNFLKFSDKAKLKNLVNSGFLITNCELILPKLATDKAVNQTTDFDQSRLGWVLNFWLRVAV